MKYFLLAKNLIHECFPSMYFKRYRTNTLQSLWQMKKKGKNSQKGDEKTSLNTPGLCININRLVVRRNPSKERKKHGKSRREKCWWKFGGKSVMAAGGVAFGTPWIHWVNVVGNKEWIKLCKGAVNHRFWIYFSVSLSSFFFWWTRNISFSGSLAFLFQCNINLIF